MLLVPCPICGERPEAEFTYAGEAHIARSADPSAQDDEAWGGFLYARTNPKGDHAERWRHTHGCGRFFNAIRNTHSDIFVATYPSDTPRPATHGGAGTASADAPPMRTGTEQWGQA